jgi:two-component system chemotaxis response regulator CheY
MKLLIVDDSNYIRRSIERAVNARHALQILTAADGLIALGLFQSFQPDLVTLDLTMPHMDGLCVLDEMLRIRKETRIIVVSALADDATAIEALKRGALDFVCKPFTSEEIIEAIEEIL